MEELGISSNRWIGNLEEEKMDWWFQKREGREILYKKVLAIPGKGYIGIPGKRKNSNFR